MRPLLDFVSPLPPVRSGIADYSLDLLPRLEPLCDLRVLRLPGQDVREDVVERWRPEPAERAGEGGRLPLYQMGNNRYHEAVERLALERPGVLTLHDLVLHHLLLDRTLGRGDYGGYRERLAADHGWVGEAAARPRRWGGYGDAAHFFLPAHRGLVLSQRGILVHSGWAAAILAEEMPEARVRAMPMGVPLPAPVDPAARRVFRERFGIPADAPLVGSFGFQTPIKRPAVAVGALAARGLERAHLVIAGEVAPILDLEAEARKAGVAERVHVIGFLDFEELQAGIAACHVCLNLRYPTAGETSASLLRILAVGRPAVVSDYAQFTELPEAVALKVPPGEGEATALAALLAGVLGEPGRLADMGRAAREYVRREHDPAAAALDVVEACRDWARLPPPTSAAVEPPPPTSLTWRRLPGTIAVAGTEPPWRAGERRRLRIRCTNGGPARWRAGDTGPGGVVLEVRLESEGEDLLAGHPWLPLPRAVEPGEAVEVELEIRRPPGAARLRVEPRVLGYAVFTALDGPTFEADL